MEVGNYVSIYENEMLKIGSARGREHGVMSLLLSIRVLMKNLGLHGKHVTSRTQRWDSLERAIPCFPALSLSI